MLLALRIPYLPIHLIIFPSGYINLVKKIYLVIAETALETIPEKVAYHKSVINESRRRGISPTNLLLDRSKHHSIMMTLDDNAKRGRPDIAYHILLDVTASPLYKFGIMKLFFHTVQDFVISLADNLRPPRSYDRYEGLMIKLFERGVVGDNLIMLEHMNFGDLVKRLSPTKIIGFSRLGELKPLPQIVEYSLGFECPMFVVGGFPKGHFSDSVLSYMDIIYSISKLRLDSSYVVNRLLCEIERDNNIDSMMGSIS